MKTQSLLTRILAIAGTVLIWFPIFFPILLSVIFLLNRRGFHFDYLMPAEFFPVALLGGAVLLWAAVRAHSRRKLIGWGLAVAVALLVGGQALAVSTGLASGATPRGGWQEVLVLATLAIYSLALVGIGTGGILLLRDLFSARKLIPR